MNYQAIVDDVESGGLKSLTAQALRLGDIQSESDPLILGPAEMKAAYDALPEEDQQVLLRTKVRASVIVCVGMYCCRCGGVGEVRVQACTLAAVQGRGRPMLP